MDRITEGREEKRTDEKKGKNSVKPASSDQEDLLKRRKTVKGGNGGIMKISYKGSSGAACATKIKKLFGGRGARLEKVGRSDKACRTTNGSTQFRQSSSDNQWE